MVATKKNFDINPNPDFPPYVVKTLHFVELRLRWNTNTAWLDAQDTPDPRPGDFALIFMRVKLKNDDSTAEWRRRHSSTTTRAHKNDLPQGSDDNATHPGSQVFYVEETIGFDKNRRHSAAELGCRGPGVPTIIIYKETITFNNNHLV